MDVGMPLEDMCIVFPPEVCILPWIELTGQRYCPGLWEWVLIRSFDPLFNSTQPQLNTISFIFLTRTFYQSVTVHSLEMPRVGHTHTHQGERPGLILVSSGKVRADGNKLSPASVAVMPSTSHDRPGPAEWTQRIYQNFWGAPGLDTVKSQEN